MVARRLVVACLSALIAGTVLSRPVHGQVKPMFGGVMVTVTPAKTVDSVTANGWLDSLKFTVKNTGSVADKFNLTVTCTTVSCPTAPNPTPAGPVWLTVNQSVTEWVRFYHPSTPVSGSVSLMAADTADLVERTGTTTVVGIPAGPFPVVDLSPFNANDQDMSRCAASCFAASYAQSTVP